MTQSNKSKHLSVYEYYQILQLEWIVADLRAKIYPRIKDKEYWQRVREGKRAKIESIAEKNHLPTIFTDEEMRRAYEQRIYRETGSPNFLYKDDEAKRAQEPFDLQYYYYKGADVRFELFNEMTVGKIKSYMPHSPTITVVYEKDENVGEITLPLSNVTRIL